jgi:PAS domain S-box-containing protein
MQPVYRRASVIAGFVAMVVLLLLNLWLTRRQLDQQVVDHDHLIQSEEMQQELTQTALLIDDAETGQRGYLYTGQLDYLEPYDRAISEIDGHLQNLAQLATTGAPGEAEEIARLRELAHTKLNELHETIAAYQSGHPDQTRTLVLSGAGKLTMDQIRRVVATLEQQELDLEKARTEAYVSTVRITRISIYLATALAIIGLALLAYFILKQMMLRDRHAAELRLREEWYRVTLTSIGDAVIATDARGVVTFLNPIAERLTGCEGARAKGRLIADVFPIFNEYTQEPVANPVEKVVLDGRTIGLANHTVLQRTDGVLIPIEDSAAPIFDDRKSLIGVVLVFRDATIDRERQEMLRKAEKIAAASRLASTVAHEINNPLEAVGNLVYLARNEPGLPAEAAAHLAIAEDELRRVEHIAKQTLAFYRESTRWEPVNLAKIIESSLTLYSNKLANKNVSVTKDIARDAAFLGSSGEMKQMISNLISNAIDAISVNGRLQIIVSTDGNNIELRIEDDGPGIHPGNLSKIFEPFFTTKKDVGTGLGLWVARQIAERHGGTIEARSGAPGSLPGASFLIRLPVSQTEGNPHPA